MIHNKNLENDETEIKANVEEIIAQEQLILNIIE